MFGALKRGFRSTASLILLLTLLTYFNRKEYLRHRAVSLRQHGFLVNYWRDLASTLRSWK